MYEILIVVVVVTHACCMRLDFKYCAIIGSLASRREVECMDGWANGMWCLPCIREIANVVEE
jgi:hypothetical protein